MITYLVEATPTEHTSPACTLAWRWRPDRVVPDHRDIPVSAGHQLDTSVHRKRQIPWEAWSSIGASVVLASGVARQALGELYTWVRPPAIARFLEDHPTMAPLLIEAHEQIQRHFGPRTVTLDVVVDPEGDDEPRLVARVRTSLDPVQALGILDQFDSEWWLDASLRGGDRICITLEYQ